MNDNPGSQDPVPDPSGDPPVPGAQSREQSGVPRASENGEVRGSLGVGRPYDDGGHEAHPEQPDPAEPPAPGQPHGPTRTPAQAPAQSTAQAPAQQVSANQTVPPWRPGNASGAGNVGNVGTPGQQPGAGHSGPANQTGPGGQPGRGGQPAEQRPPGQSGQSGQSTRTGQPGQPGDNRSAPAYWAQRPADPPASPTARRRGGDSPLSYRQPETPAYAGGGHDRPMDPDDPITEEVRRPTPKYGLKGVLYKLTRINLGPGRRDLDEQDVRERLNRQARRTRGYCGYIGIGSEKGGVGKTTLASLLAAEIAEGRRESVGVADLNPDLGTLPDRFGVRPHYSIRDLLAHVDEIPWRYHVHDFMEKVPEMNVRVLAASTDRKIRHQLSVSDVELLAELFAPFFSFAILDNGTHITHEAMLGTLRTAHGMVLVTDNTRDGANLARKTLQFLTDNGFPDMRRRVVLAVIAKETASPIKVRAIEKAFREHVRDLVVVPYDPALDGGGKIPFRDPNAMNKLLRKETRAAVRQLAAIVMDDLVN